MERPAGDWTSSDTAIARLSESYWDPIYAYLQGGRANPKSSLDIHPLRVDDADKRVLVAFLKTLTESWC